MSDPGIEPNDLRAMLRICTVLQSVRELYGARDSASVRVIFEKHLATLILELIPADRAAVVLDDNQFPETDIDRELFERVRRDDRGMFTASDGRSVVVAPLLVRNEIAGVLYLESRSAASPLGHPQFLLLSALAQIASLALENAFQVEWLEGEVRRLESDLYQGNQLLGESRKMVELRERIARVAPTDTTVLVVGESGTGKELVARALHRNSSRKNKPFVALNCAALTETLLESELFGHEKGSFTGAISQKRGRLEMAESGTVFLDEIGEMPLSLQAKMLRVLQQREFERVGGTRTIQLDIRLIAATNRNLDEAVRQGTFRQDLYYRLNVVSLRTPPLRERSEDILLLANEFAMRLSERCGRRVTGISPEARGFLRTYDWPGNVRELENAIERAIVLGSSDLIRAEDLPETLRDSRAAGEDAPQSGMLQDAILAAKRAVVQRAFEQANQDHSVAARLLGVHPNYLYRLVRNLGPAVPAKTAGRF